jgi:hypothetical protein
MGNESSTPAKSSSENLYANSIRNYCKRAGTNDILNEPLKNFYIRTSHNSYLDGVQLGGQSLVQNTRNCILGYKARCIELDLCVNKNTANIILDPFYPNKPVVSHGGSDVYASNFSDQCEDIAKTAFAGTDDPLIIYLEINSLHNETYVKDIASHIRKYLGKYLYSCTLDKVSKGDFANYMPNAPIKNLLGKICIVMNFYLSDLKQSEKGKAIDNRDKYLFPLVHATTDEPSNGWANNGIILMKGQSENDTPRSTFNTMERVYPANIFLSGNYRPGSWFARGYSLIALNLSGGGTSNEELNGLFADGSIIPKNWYTDRNGYTQRAGSFSLGFIKNAPLFKNKEYKSKFDILLPHDVAYSNDCIWRAQDNFKLAMQGDGNLVIYNRDNRAVWNTGTSGNPGAMLIMQSDGNLVIYTTGMRAIWSSGTSGRTTTGAIFNKNGEFFIVNNDKTEHRLY